MCVVFYTVQGATCPPGPAPDNSPSHASPPQPCTLLLLLMVGRVIITDPIAQIPRPLRQRRQRHGRERQGATKSDIIQLNWGKSRQLPFFPTQRHTFNAFVLLLLLLLVLLVLRRTTAAGVQHPRVAQKWYPSGPIQKVRTPRGPEHSPGHSR